MPLRRLLPQMFETDFAERVLPFGSDSATPRLIAAERRGVTPSLAQEPARG
jgi:hypothetical protein